MTDAPHLVFGLREWFDMFTHFLSLSLLSVGGTISTAPDMHRFLVDQQHWLSDAQFNASMAIAQAAPGPNVLWVALLGWHVGINAGGEPFHDAAQGSIVGDAREEDIARPIPT